MALKKFLFLPFLVLSLASNIYCMEKDTNSPSPTLLANNNYIAQQPSGILDHIFIKILSGGKKPDTLSLSKLGQTSHYFSTKFNYFKTRLETDIHLNKRILSKGKWHNLYGKGFSKIANKIIQINEEHLLLIASKKDSLLEKSPYFMPNFNLKIANTTGYNNLVVASGRLNTTGHNQPSIGSLALNTTGQFDHLCIGSLGLNATTLEQLSNNGVDLN